MEKEQDRSVKCLQFDNDGEYTSKEFQIFYEECGIKRYFSVKKIFQQNGMAKRMNQTLMKKARCIRLQTGLSKAFWVDSVDVACYLVNRSSHIRLDGRISKDLCLKRTWSWTILGFLGIRLMCTLILVSRASWMPSQERWYS